MAASFVSFLFMVHFSSIYYFLQGDCYRGVGQGDWKVFVTGYHITKVIIWSKYSQSNGFKHQNKINFVLIKRLLAGKCMFESFSILWNVVPRLCITLKVSISLGLVGYFSI